MSALVVWRLCAAKYAATAYDGSGARLYGGRWSLPGTALAYTAESRALAVVEVLANADDPDVLLHLDWVFVGAEVPAAHVEHAARVPESWRRFPHSIETQLFGTEWARSGRSVALRVPSAVVPGEFNYLVNAAHPDFSQVRIGRPEPFAFDARLA